MMNFSEQPAFLYLSTGYHVLAAASIESGDYFIQYVWRSGD